MNVIVYVIPTTDPQTVAVLCNVRFHDLTQIIVTVVLFPLLLLCSNDKQHKNNATY